MLATCKRTNNQETIIGRRVTKWTTGPVLVMKYQKEMLVEEESVPGSRDGTKREVRRIMAGAAL